jgi:putative transposase
MHGPLGEVTESDPAALAAFIGNQRTEHHVPHRIACRILGVSESWFYKWRDKPATARETRRGRLADEIRRICHDWVVPAAIRRSGSRSYGRGGGCRRTPSRRSWPNSASGRRIRRRRSLTRSGKRAAAPDFVCRDFTADAPDQVWCGDMTEIESGEGRIYLATVIDLFSRRALTARSSAPARTRGGSARGC